MVASEIGGSSTGSGRRQFASWAGDSPMLVLPVALVVDIVVPVGDVLVVDGLAPLPPQEMKAYEVPRS